MGGTMRLDKTVARKLNMNSPEFEAANMFIVDGTPAELWAITRDTNRLVRNLGERKVLSEPRLRRDVANKFFRTENGELIKIN